ncbi:hypothetical protein MKW98_009236 [Papaver atlanticum]|uniref:Uncharacterized protein n=1 Tax=Papaver atlanticum TaxID=357466 RepID=A0AAD4T2W4_9MAGN|nr:hypothetical protein MKW98_009236 [Papaver atlanticum]
MAAQEENATSDDVSMLPKLKKFNKSQAVGEIENDQETQMDGGNEATSWVAFTDGERLLGAAAKNQHEAAKNQHAANPMRTVFDIKRLTGRNLSVRRRPESLANKRKAIGIWGCKDWQSESWWCLHIEHR